MNTIGQAIKGAYRSDKIFSISMADLLLKRGFDIIISFCSLMILSPLFLLISITIKCDSSGPVVFKSLRIGQRTRPFFMYKFRTMRKNAEELLEKDPEQKSKFEINFKLKNDSRITRLGKLLRRTGLDELPQLVNILKGQMSLVGPRPILKEETRRTTPKRFLVPPGLTGIWQISGKNSLSYEEKCSLDDWYADHRSIIIDIKIIFKTVSAVINGNGFF